MFKISGFSSLGVVWWSTPELSNPEAPKHCSPKTSEKHSSESYPVRCSKEMSSCVEEISEVPKFQSVGVMQHDDVTWKDVDLIKSLEVQWSRVLKCSNQKFSKGPMSRSSGKQVFISLTLRVIKYVGVKYSKARSVEVLKCHSAMACWRHLKWCGHVQNFGVQEFWRVLTMKLSVVLA